MKKIGDLHTSMEDLARLNSQDQFTHGYMPLYDALFQSIRFECLNILEIGFSRGRGARTLAEYFYRSTVHCLELDYNVALPYYENLPAALKERVRLRPCDQGDKDQLRAFLRGKHTNLFNLIIDDGSHDPAHQLSSFEVLWPALVPGGIYVIEDMHPYYKDGGHPTINHFVNQIHLINKKGDIKNDKIETPDIEWVMFPNNRVVLRKR